MRELAPLKSVIPVVLLNQSVAVEYAEEYIIVEPSDLPARLGLKDGHSSRLFEARGLYFRWPQPMRKYINVFGR